MPTTSLAQDWEGKRSRPIENIVQLGRLSPVPHSGHTHRATPVVPEVRGKFGASVEVAMKGGGQWGATAGEPSLLREGSGRGWGGRGRV